MKVSINNKIINKRTKNILFNILGLLFVFILWYILSIVYNNSLVIPRIKEVFKSLYQLLISVRFYSLFFTMIFRIILTLLCSLVLSIILAVLSFISESIHNFLNPIIVIMRTIPIIAIIILLLMSIGMKVAPYIATAFVIVPLIYEMVYASLKNIDSTITEDIKTITGINLTVILKFYLPLVFPSIVTSLIQSFGLGLKVMLMAEFISPMRDTFGAEINRYYNLNMMSEVFAIVIIVIVVVFLTDKLMKLAREKVYYN